MAHKDDTTWVVVGILVAVVLVGYLVIALEINQAAGSFADGISSDLGL